MCVDLLREGYGVRFRAGGASMHPNIRDGELITVDSLRGSSASVGDILLYRTDSGVIAHRVEQIDNLKAGTVYILRGDSAISRDKPVDASRVLGRVVAVERDGRKIELGGRTNKVIHKAASTAFRLRQRVSGVLGNISAHLCVLRGGHLPAKGSATDGAEAR